MKTFNVPQFCNGFCCYLKCTHFSFDKVIKLFTLSCLHLKNHLKEWLRNQKWRIHFPRPFISNIFIIINYYFSFYQLHALIYVLKFILEFKKLEIVENLYFKLKWPL